MPTAQDTHDLDVLTIASVAIVAYCVTNVIHEGLGHGGACLLVGGKPEMLNAIFFNSADEGMSDGGLRILNAGGSIANLIFAGLAYLGLRLRGGRPGTLHYFLWLMLALNVLMPFGYLLFSGLSGYGDWAVFIEGLGPPPLLLRGVLAVIGLYLYRWIAPKIIMPAINPYLGRDPAERARRARKLSLLPYLVGGASYILAGLFNPYGWKLVLLSAAAASLGGTSLLAWYPGGGPDKEYRAAAPERPAGIPRSWPWVVAAVVTLGIFVGILGPGITF